MRFKQRSQNSYSVIAAHLLSAPFIYGMIVPLVFLDLCIEVYHRICFPLYGMKPLQRSRYITFDRYRLKYLNTWEKLNCLYCEYANGLMSYAMTIVAETEGYWCGIRHQKKAGFVEPGHHQHFLPYGDERSYKEFVTSSANSSKQS